MTTLVTGFESFGAVDVNSSELVVAALAAFADAGVVAAILPTSYFRAEKRVGELLEVHRPDSVLMLGHAEKATKICLEQIALNFDSSDAPDNDGEVRSYRSIIEGGPASYRSSIHLEHMANAARDLGVDVELSRDAGGYVCNHVFFTVAHLVAKKFPSTRFGFVHLPPLHGSSEDLARLVYLVRNWIAAMDRNPPG